MTITQYEVFVDEAGHLIVPEALQKSLGLQVGDSLTVWQDQDGLWLIPTRLVVPEVAQKINAMLAEAQLTVADLLADTEIREALFREQYGHLLDE